MRDTFVKEITKLAEKNKKIVILAGDIGYKLFDNFIKRLKKKSGLNVASGIFGSDMKVNLLNDGPVTIIMDSKNRL